MDIPWCSDLKEFKVEFKEDQHDSEELCQNLPAINKTMCHIHELTTIKLLQIHSYISLVDEPPFSITKQPIYHL